MTKQALLEGNFARRMVQFQSCSKLESAQMLLPNMVELDESLDTTTSIITNNVHLT